MMDEIRHKIVEYALAQENKPYAEQGWGPVAWDCIGLFVMSGVATGVCDYDRSKETDPRFKAYSSKAEPKILLSALKKYFVRVHRDDVMIGDGLLFRDPKAQHFGVITKVNPLYVVHASLNGRVVKHSRVINPFYVVCGWKYPGVNDG